jgi:hypothetical protein
MQQKFKSNANPPPPTRPLRGGLYEATQPSCSAPPPPLCIPPPLAIPPPPAAIPYGNRYAGGRKRAAYAGGGVYSPCHKKGAGFASGISE